jgi:hypothetical protein
VTTLQVAEQSGEWLKLRGVNAAEKIQMRGREYICSTTGGQEKTGTVK